MKFKIVALNKHLTFNHVEVGEVFYRGGSFYMKVRSAVAKDNLKQEFNAIRLSSGNFEYIPDNWEVQAVEVDATFTVVYS